MAAPWIAHIARWLKRGRKRKKQAPPRPTCVRGELDDLVVTRPLGCRAWTGGPEGERLLAADPWFHGHYVFASHVVHEALSPHVDWASARVLDLGCGDGIMALGALDLGAASVVGVDLTRAFETLPRKAREVLGRESLPAGLEFRQSEPGRPLPFADGECDAVYSWSVFEHVAQVPGLMAEAARVLRDDGWLFLQIEPLYFSPFGSHLMRLVDEPWAHLSLDQDAFLARASAASDHVPDQEKDLLYENNAFEDVKRYLVAEYGTLNRITSHELVREVRAAGFEIAWCEVGQYMHLPVPAALAARFPLHDLVTSEIRLLARKARRGGDIGG
jgi:SAM-dependent methyltransferase